jgi:hypothetical protein
MSEVTSTPDDPNGAKRLAYRTDSDFPPPRTGRWKITQVPGVYPQLYWVGRAADLATAIPPRVRQLMVVQRTFHAVRQGHRIRLKYEPELVNFKRLGPMYWLCALADFGCYLLDPETGGFTWIELPMQPRLEPEISKRLLKATRTKRSSLKT